MQSKNFSIALTVLSAIFTVSPFVTGTPAVAEEKVLYAFGDKPKDGNWPLTGLIFDSVGNLYGTTVIGGAYNYGTAFELMPKAGGGWTESVLHSFNHNGKDGYEPYAGLIFDSAGSLYGTTLEGGTGLCMGSVGYVIGCGAVFELTPASGGKWTERVLHDFNNKGTDAQNPEAGLTFDAAGNLYSTTNAGGAYASGTAFELTPKAGGDWTETVLHDFNNKATDGNYPYAGLIFDATGNLYGTTYLGGTYGHGAVFEMMPAAGGGWSETVLHNFKGGSTDGRGPYAGLILDAAGNLYGTTTYGGVYGHGTVFELTPAAGGAWTETVLHDFGHGTDGYEPYAGLILDAAGNLYGTTVLGGTYGSGTVFELTPATGGSWTETVLHHFGNGTDGARPYGGLIFDAAGNLYGTTQQGGAYGYGTVFEITP
jgi:uncharacterized repeat protein (TIGR03803 family)